MLELLRSETGENERDNIVEETESETRNFYTPTKIVRLTLPKITTRVVVLTNATRRIETSKTRIQSETIGLNSVSNLSEEKRVPSLAASEEAKKD